MNRFILADAEKCIGCRTCEVACVVSHQQDQDALRQRLPRGRNPPRKFGLARRSTPLHRMQKLYGSVPLWRDDRDAGGGGRTGAEVRFMQPSRRRPGLRGGVPDPGAALHGADGAGKNSR